MTESMLDINTSTAQAFIEQFLWSPCYTVWEWLHDVCGQVVGGVGNNLNRYVNTLYVVVQLGEESAILQLLVQIRTLKNKTIMALRWPSDVKVYELVGVMQQHTVPALMVVVVTVVG